jgi:acyl-CoA reductase-like NAD-dependent aldehyde dehydrogenase
LELFQDAKETVMSEIHVRCPRTNRPLYDIPEATTEDVAAAYARARKAQRVLGAMTVRERLAQVAKLKHYILKNKDHIAQRISEETGKCITDALLLEVYPALDIIDHYEKTAEKSLADERVSTPLVMFGKHSRVFYEPLGILLVISPWNYPFHLSFIPAVSALIAGNAVILKPSQYTPLRGVVEDMVRESGFVTDAFQVVYATRRSAKALIDQRPDKIMFTGSVGAGKIVMEQAAQYLIPVELELGGKDPMVAFDDVDLGRTVNGALWGAFVNCGQTCTSIERLYVQEGIYDVFVSELVEKVKKLHIPTDSQSENDGGQLDVGCMTTDAQLETVERQLAEAVAQGATILTGGKRVPGTRIFPPTVVTNVNHSMSVVKDETFGPVVVVMKFKTEDEAIALANDSIFGLSASVWSRDLVRAKRVARAIYTGNVSINSALATQANSALPYGGLKDSGFGRYRGHFGLHAFSNIKSVFIDKQKSMPEMYWYPYSPKKYKLFGNLLDALYGGGLLWLLKAGVAGARLFVMSIREKL